MIKKSQIQNDLKIGQILRLGSLTKTSGGTVCVLYPYQTGAPAGYLQHARINSYLEETGYTAGEYRWAFVVVESESRAVNLSKFRRFGKLDILSPHGIQPKDKAKLPKDFKPVSCAPLENAVVTKIESEDRIYLVLGKG